MFVVNISVKQSTNNLFGLLYILVLLLTLYPGAKT